ncbi:MAG: ribosome small subunit-dependent GTPase A [Candidatus Melainabacteria bacterium]|nr:ribosome small subunit-dependent GTPase A [Candidatus Melainabacteria bacterium]
MFETQSMASLFCQARKRLKKEHVSILTGDRVELVDVDFDKGTATITGCCDRWSLLTRPPLANVDQVVIVQAVRQPEWNQLWCDRYIVHFQLELPDAKPVLCFNKCDLIDEEQSSTLRGIYEPLGYNVVLLSTITGGGLDELSVLLAGKITVFAGPSGVGKSSILNKLDSSLKLKIGVMDNDFGVGRQTTTYSKLYQVLSGRYPETPTWVADTPGFNLQEIKYPMPADVMWQFPEIAAYSNDCKFSNCMHLVETDCKVIENIVEDDEPMPVERNPDAPLPVARERYENYVLLQAEAQEVYNQRRSTSSKVETGVKTTGGEKGKGKAIPKLDLATRSESRRREKQRFKPSILLDDESELDMDEYLT